ncbi:MAG TPA: ThuA domain-containing protein [Clostridia bacterium]|nr:ThuA domain-containing protein [Clostridia bacterium]
MLNVLVLCDDYWHPGEVIEMGIKPLEGPEFHFDFVKAAKDILTPEMIAEYQVIVCCKGNSINAANRSPWLTDDVTEVTTKEFEDYVKNGGGFLAVHSGNTSREGDEYTEFVGNYFVGHPPRCDVNVNITGEHPIVDGVKDFTIRDEHYNIHVTADDITELFTTTSETGGTQMGGYTREMGQGRLCVLTPGHILDVWKHDEFKKIFLNAIRWCGKKK